MLNGSKPYTRDVSTYKSLRGACAIIHLISKCRKLFSIAGKCKSRNDTEKNTDMEQISKVTGNSPYSSMCMDS